MDVEATAPEKDMAVQETSVAEYLILRALLTGVLEEHLKGPVPAPKELMTANYGLTDAHRRWLMLLDLCAAPEALRLGLKKRDPSEESLITLLHFLVRLGREVDHDRFDWVITYLFKRRLENGELPGTAGIGAEIARMFPNFPQPPLSESARQQLSVMKSALTQIDSFTSFKQLTQSGIIEKGREWKEGFREERYHPAVLAAVVNYNLVLGKAFRGLFDDSAGRSRGLAAKLTEGDYRSNVEPLRRLAGTPGGTPGVSASTGPERHREMEYEMTPSSDSNLAAIATDPGLLPIGAPIEAVSGGETAPPAGCGPMLDPARELGIDEGRETQKMGYALRSLAAFFEIPENRSEPAARIGNITVTLAEWEMRALQTAYRDDDTSFRAEFARMMKHAATLTLRMSEEADNLFRTSSSEYSWKPHYDSLVWLFAEGRNHLEALDHFAEATGKRGLPDKQQQAVKSSGRLASALELAAKNF